MESITVKDALATLAIVLTFVGYSPYFRDLIAGRTTPHIFSWLVWSVVTTIIFALQLSAGAGLGAFVTLSVALISFAIFLIGLRKGHKNIKPIDVVFLVLALATIPIWLISDEPVLSMVLLSTIDLLGFAPTIRKSWNEPYSETLSLYVITFFRHSLSLFALQAYNIVTMLFPATWVIANLAFAVMLMYRRRVLRVGASRA
jgi:hypothetical protein